MSQDRDGGGCGSVRALLDRYVREALAEDDRLAVRGHLEGCRGCRAALDALDPTVLLFDTRRAPLPDRFWEEFDRTLRARLEAGRPRRRLRDRLAGLLPGPRVALWAAPAAVLLAVGLLTIFAVRPGGLLPGLRPPQVEGLRSPYAPPGRAPRARAGLERGTAHLPRPGAGAPSGDLPALEEVASPAARVYRFDAPVEGEPPIYLVVDETIRF